jgi:hypothetical protein
LRKPAESASRTSSATSPKVGKPPVRFRFSMGFCQGYPPTRVCGPLAGICKVHGGGAAETHLLGLAPPCEAQNPFAGPRGRDHQKRLPPSAIFARFYTAWGGLERTSAGDYKRKTHIDNGISNRGGYQRPSKSDSSSDSVSADPLNPAIRSRGEANDARSRAASQSGSSRLPPPRYFFKAAE